MTRHLHDLDFLTSVALLGSAAVAAATGIIADLWDLNDFWYHTVSGYVVAGFAVPMSPELQRLDGLRALPLATRCEGRPRRPRLPRPRQARPPPRDDHCPRRSLALSRAACSASASVARGLVLGRGLRRRRCWTSAPTSAWSTTSGASRASSMRSARSEPGSRWSSTRSTPEYPGPTCHRRHGPRGGRHRRDDRHRRSVRAYAPTTHDPRRAVAGRVPDGGIRADLQRQRPARGPSSGALYPIELYAGRPSRRRDHSRRLPLRGAGSMPSNGPPRRLPSAVVQHGIAQEFLGSAASSCW